MTYSNAGTAATEGGEKVGFISLGCPKALVDSERILTQLRIEGYEITPHYEDAGVVIVNTCGFIDAAKEESLEAIGEAISENGRVLVTGCMGRGEDAETIRARHPKVLGISGPAAYEDIGDGTRGAAASSSARPAG